MTKKKQSKTLLTSFQVSQVIKQARNQSNELKKKLDDIIDHYERELDRLDKLEEPLRIQTEEFQYQELKLAKERKSFIDERDRIRKSIQEEKEEAWKEIAEREVRILNIEQKIATSTTVETKMGRNQVVKLNVGGKLFSTNLATLLSVKETFFTGYFSDYFNPTVEEDDKAFFIDRPFEQFHLILNYLRGIDIQQKLECLDEDDLLDFIEEVVYYQITPIYEILPHHVKSLLTTKYGINESDAKNVRVKFDKNNCSNRITLETSTMLRGSSICWSTVLGTKSNNFKVKLISNCSLLMIGFAPQSIDVNSKCNHSQCGHYLYCYEGTLFSENGDSHKSYYNQSIKDGSIVECSITNGNISYTINGNDIGTAFSNISNSDDLFPAFEVQGAVFELLNH